MSKRSGFLVGLALLLATLPAAAADSVIGRGIDTWTTVPEFTFVSFTGNPLPAGFFCSEFPGYTGQVWLKGVPLASTDPDALGTTDTIIERLDNAVFNKNGVARTRVRVRALQLEGIENLKTACGDYNVKVTLDGEQPVTTMRIIRENARGGRFLVGLPLNTKITFTRVDNEAEQFEISFPVRFSVNPHFRWTYRNLVPEVKRIDKVMVDTDWDGTPDALVPGTSNFSTRDGRKNTLLELADDSGCAHGVT
jgi:hypothetical protein